LNKYNKKCLNSFGYYKKSYSILDTVKYMIEHYHEIEKQKIHGEQPIFIDFWAENDLTWKMGK